MFFYDYYNVKVKKILKTKVETIDYYSYYYIYIYVMIDLLNIRI